MKTPTLVCLLWDIRSVCSPQDRPAFLHAGAHNLLYNKEQTVKKWAVGGIFHERCHHGSFFGYKVHILIDAESEMPIGMLASSGEENDAPYFLPLLDDFKEHYSFDEAVAVLADGAYDVKSFRKKVTAMTGGIFLPACNPRRSKVLMRMKLRVRKLFKTHGAKIKSVQDAFRYLGQTFLTRFGIELGDRTDNRLVEMITERLQRPYRAAVERAFSRLKSMMAFERPKTRNIGSVWKTLWFCLIGDLVQALTAKEIGLPGSMRKRTMLA